MSHGTLQTFEALNLQIPDTSDAESSQSAMSYVAYRSKEMCARFLGLCYLVKTYMS